MPDIQLKRGAQSNALAASLQTGEPVFCTDTGLLLIYDGSDKKLIGKAVSGTFASRPSAGVEGRMYFSTDGKKLYYDNGSSWDDVGAPSPAGVENLENNLALMAWDFYSEDRQFDDLCVDDFTDETGVDTANSTALYNSTDNYYSKDTGSDIDLRQASWEASTNDPTSAYAVLKVEPVDSITINTDLKVWVSMDDGVNYEQMITYELFLEIGVVDFYRFDISNLTARTDSTMRLKVTGHNSKDFKVHAWALGVKY